MLISMIKIKKIHRKLQQRNRIGSTEWKLVIKALALSFNKTSSEALSLSQIYLHKFLSLLFHRVKIIFFY